jgi:hypothetical protein
VIELDLTVPYDPTPDFQAYGMPNFWMDVQMLASLVKDVTQYQSSIPNIVEIGSWSGRTALTMLNATQGHAQIHCFDLWFMQEDGYFKTHECGISIMEAFCRNVGDELFRQIQPHPGRSEFWAQHWHEPLDFVYIDGDHSYEGVLRDIHAWTPHVRKGGIIAGHDYRWHEVRRAVEETGGGEYSIEGGDDINRHMFPDPDNWGGIWYRRL